MLQTLIHGLAHVISQSQRRRVLKIASGLADICYFLYRLSPQRQFMANNIRRALPQHAAHHLARQHVRLLLWSIVDLLRFRQFKTKPQLPDELEINGWEHFTQAHAQGRGVLLISAHFGCWELIPAATALQGYPTTVLVQKPSQDGFDHLFREYRAFAGVKTVNNDTLAGLRPVIKALKRGETVGLVIDQHGESERLIGQFFGQSVSLPEGPAYLAQHLNCPLVPVSIRWVGDRHQLQFSAALQAHDYPAPLSLMQALYDQLEQQIRRYPQNWLWSYNRWDKYQP